jgi:hypothetical protein
VAEGVALVERLGDAAGSYLLEHAAQRVGRSGVADGLGDAEPAEQ